MKQPCAKRAESGGSAFGTESARVLTRRLTGPSGRGIERFEGLAALNRNGVAMPSVGMRLTTRVFGIVKGADGARVLRSGRRLWPESGDGKGSRRGSGDRDEWLRIMGGEFKKNGWVKSKEGHIIMDIDDHPVEIPEPVNALEVTGEKVAVDKMWGLVYTRKRKRLASKSHGYSDTEGVSPVKRYGLHFTRRQRRRKNNYNNSFVEVDNEDHNLDFTGQVDLDVSVPGPVLAVLGESSIASSFACFLHNVLRHMKNARVRLSDLYAFLSTEPIGLVYSSHGIRFSRELPTSGTSAICKIYRPRQFTPMFTVDFSAVPQCFMYMHMSMFLRNKGQPSVLVNNSTTGETSDEISDDEELPLFLLSKRRIPLDSSQADTVVNRTALFLPDLRSSKLGCRAQYRNGINSRGIQKRRSSLRSRRGRNPSLVGPQKPNGSLVSELSSIRKSGAPFSSLLGSAKFRRSVRGSSGGNLNEQSSTMVKLPPDVNSCCSANILVTDSDRCQREEGAKVMLEMSSSGEWCLVVKKDETMRYSHRAQNVMRSWTCNRFTHAIIWTGDNDWKLEFPNRQDWAIFKDLYKECSDRNVPLSPNIKTIPVPGVREVSDYEDSNNAAFFRPDSYLKLNNNEVERALAKKTANYDMDTEDEEWLNNFNSEVLVGDEIDGNVSDDNFELMIDAFERALYCSPDDCSDENAAINLCLDMGRREVVEAIYNYWMKKRKLKRSALIRVFQAHQQKRASLSTKSVLRKKRSFKRHPSQSGRGKKPSVLQAIAAEHGALETQKAMQRLEEAKASLKRCTEIALGKRKRAQYLMENADLATYKAAMAIRIAEMSQSSYSTDVSCTHFLD